MKKACFVFVLVTSVACKVLPPWERPGMTAEIAENGAKIEDLVFILSSPGKPDILIPINDVVDSKDWTTSTTEELTTTLSSTTTVNDPDWTMPIEPTTSTVSTTTDSEHFPESTSTPDCIMQEEMEYDDKTTTASTTTIEISTKTTTTTTTTTAATTDDSSLLDTIRNVGSYAWNSFTDLGTTIWNLLGRIKYLNHIILTFIPTSSEVIYYQMRIHLTSRDIKIFQTFSWLF
jgi:hypothetical protein